MQPLSLKLSQKNGYLSKLLTKDSLLPKEIFIHQHFSNSIAYLKY
jgi:hypothetical protein